MNTSVDKSTFIVEIGFCVQSYVVISWGILSRSVFFCSAAVKFWIAQARFTNMDLPTLNGIARILCGFAGEGARLIHEAS